MYISDLNHRVPKVIYHMSGMNPSDTSDNVTYVYEVCYAKSVSYEQSLQQWEFEIIRVR